MDPFDLAAGAHQQAVLVAGVDVSALAGFGVEFDQDRRDVFVVRRGGVEQGIGERGQFRQRRNAPQQARIVACMLLIKSEAGSPLPETSATQIRCVCPEMRSAS